MVCIIGNEGSTGRRYKKILLGMGMDVVGYDLPESDAGEAIPTADRYIICSPTSLHYTHWSMIKDNTKQEHILCEKPLSMDMMELYEMASVTPQSRMICNWAYVMGTEPLLIGMNSVMYNFQKTGPDGLRWDTIQLNALARQGAANISSTSPTFRAKINNKEITLEDIEKSYERMLVDWLGRNRLWTFRDVQSTHLQIWALKELRREN